MKSKIEQPPCRLELRFVRLEKILVNVAVLAKDAYGNYVLGSGRRRPGVRATKHDRSQPPSHLHSGFCKAALNS